MKRTLTLTLALAVVVSACGGTRPDPVPGITASATQTSLKLSWRAANGARSYRARLWPGGTGVSAAKATANTSEFTYTFSDLTCGTAYVASVTGFNGSLGPAKMVPA